MRMMQRRHRLSRRSSTHPRLSAVDPHFRWRNPLDVSACLARPGAVRQRPAAKAIRLHYPTLTLEQVYGAITFFLGNKQEVENDIVEREREEDAFTGSHPAPPEIREKFKRMRQQLSARRT